jgi:hypothetical protein
MTPIFSRTWLMKIRHVLVLATNAGEFAQGLGHQTGVQAHMAVAHLTFQFRLGHQGGHGIDHHDVDGAGGNQGAGDFERLLAMIGLRDYQIIHLHSQFGGVNRIEGVLGVDERGGAARSLCLGDDLQSQRSLARRFRSEDLDDAAAGKTADAQRRIDGDGSAGNDRDRHHGARSEQQHGSLAELLIELAEGGQDDFAAVGLFHDEVVERLAGCSQENQHTIPVQPEMEKAFSQ